QIQGCLVAVALCAITTLIAMQWLVTFDAANLVMLYLLGVVVIHALDAGIRHIILGIGGSATVDGGMGVAQALGVRFLDAQGTPL
ncbi:glycerate kinase, partial [Salmonella enterica subsp. enterica serovar Kentucky]|nr:glycerate kinase [Salmonella enterica subsp. enterica serovar Kentucky]